MMSIVFFVLAALFLLAAVHPFTLYPWSLSRFQHRPKPAPGSLQAGRPMLSICMSAYNEEKVIAAKAENLLAMAQAYGPAEILIYIDGQRDGTAAILEAYRDRIRVIASPERRGKTAGLKTLVGMASGERLAFTDANVVAAPDSLLRLGEALDDPTVGCASAHLIYTNPADTETSRSGADYWTREEWVKSQESKTIGVVGVDGALFMMRRDAYEPPPDDIIDDLYVSLTALIKGYHVVTVPGAVVEERSATSAVEEFRRKVRISCQGVNVHRLLWPRLRTLPPGLLYGYLSHRLLKWLMPYMVLASGLCGLAGLICVMGGARTLLLLLAGLALAGLGVLARLSLVVRMVVYAFMLLGVGRGVFESLVLGRRYVTWKPAVSVRV